MTFIDYPDHLPRAPLSPEAAALWERWKEICAAHNVKIVLSKPAPLPLDLDLVLPSLSTVGAGPLTWFVTKNRPAAPDAILDTFGARGPAFAELEAKAIERMTSMTKEPST